MYRVISQRQCSGYIEQRIEYDDFEGGYIPAFLLIPAVVINSPAVIVHHQHNSERHFGKSEVCGLAGNPLQAFAPILASAGFTVLAPDSICFEDRRYNMVGTKPGEDESDFMQHFLEMEYRLVRGDSLMRKVLHDANIGLTILAALPHVDTSRIGALGHSYGGNTVLFQMAIDERITFGCASGSACSYRSKFQMRTGLEMALVIPGFCNHFEMSDVIKAIAPRELLLVSATEDDYSLDADVIVSECTALFQAHQHEDEASIPEGGDGDRRNLLQSKRYIGDHQITQERFDYISNWMLAHTAI